MNQLVNYYGFGHSNSEETHNSFLSTSDIVLGSLYDMSRGDSQTKAFASYMLQNLFDMFGNDTAYHDGVKRLHNIFESEVKSRLAPSMTEEEAAEYMLKNALLSHGYDDL